MLPPEHGNGTTSGEHEQYLRPKGRRFTMTQFVVNNKLSVKFKLKMSEGGDQGEDERG